MEIRYALHQGLAKQRSSLYDEVDQCSSGAKLEFLLAFRKDSADVTRTGTPRCSAVLKRCELPHQACPVRSTSGSATVRSPRKRRGDDGASFRPELHNRFEFRAFYSRSGLAPPSAQLRPIPRVQKAEDQGARRPIVVSLAMPEADNPDEAQSPPKKKQKRNKPTLSCSECVDRKTKVSRHGTATSVIQDTIH